MVFSSVDVLKYGPDVYTKFSPLSWYLWLESFRDAQCFVFRWDWIKKKKKTKHLLSVLDHILDQSTHRNDPDSHAQLLIYVTGKRRKEITVTWVWNTRPARCHSHNPTCQHTVNVTKPHMFQAIQGTKGHVFIHWRPDGAVQEASHPIPRTRSGHKLKYYTRTKSALTCK